MFPKLALGFIPVINRSAHPPNVSIVVEPLRLFHPTKLKKILNEQKQPEISEKIRAR
jgi:hypothetical protein